MDGVWKLHLPAHPLGCSVKRKPTCADCSNSGPGSVVVASDHVRTPPPAPAQDEPFGYVCPTNRLAGLTARRTTKARLLCYERPQEVGLTDEERADMACAVAAICTGTSSRTIAATAIDWTERALRAKGQT